MTTNAGGEIKRADPYAEPLPGGGRMTIIVPLVAGCAVLLACLVLWEVRARKVRVSDMAKLEEEVRGELRDAYRELRAMRPEACLALTKRADAKVRRFKVSWPTDYLELRVSLLLMEGEALFMRDCSGGAAEAERKFGEALGLMTFASGGIWELGMLGRARTRMEQGRLWEAEEDLGKLVDRNPSFGAAYYWRSLARERLGDRAGAEADSEKARQLDSWPPLRDYAQSSCSGTRDILARPAAPGLFARPAGNAVPAMAR